MGGQLAPGHEQLHGQMRHIGQALGQCAPQGFMLLPFGVGHANAQHLFKALGNLGTGPFAVAGTLRRWRRQIALAAGHVPQHAQKGSAARHKGFALQPGFFFHQPFFDHFFGKNLKIRRLKTKMAFAGQQGAPIGRHLIRVRVGGEKFGKPLCRGQSHFALRQFPRVHHRHFGRQLLAAFAVLFKQTHGVFLAQISAVHGAKPRQKARRIEPRFPPVGQQKAQTASGLFSNKGNLNGIALQILHHATRRWVAHTIRHACSFRGAPHNHASTRLRQGQSFIFSFLASAGTPVNVRTCRFYRTRAARRTGRDPLKPL